MPANATIFLLGLTVGSILLILGIILGYWFGRKAGTASIPIQGQQFLAFLRTMSQWTSEFSGDVIKYQDQLTSINQRVQAGNTPREELLGMVTQMMDTNRHLQSRLENTEKKLDDQTEQLASYLKEARTDGLTGLLNRRAFDKLTDERFSQWQKHQKPFCIGLIDIDHFKKINDTHGHPAGDAVLKQVAKFIQSEMPNALCVARFGGEEFSVLALPPIEEVAQSLDKLRNSISKTPIEFDGKAIKVTLSCGISQVSNNERIGTMVRRADEALYASKTGGRNRVHLHDGQACRLVTSVGNSPVPIRPLAPVVSADMQQQADMMTAKIQQRLRRIVEEESQRVAER